MVAPSAGEVVLVPFPFSDLSQSKLRPAVCLERLRFGGRSPAGAGSYKRTLGPGDPLEEGALPPIRRRASPSFGALADAGRGDRVLCQVTSSPYGDPLAVPPGAGDFATGGLLVASFARPGKRLTAGAGLMVKSVGTRSPAALSRVLSAVVASLQPPAGP